MFLVPFLFIFCRYFNGGPPAETDFGGDVSVSVVSHLRVVNMLILSVCLVRRDAVWSGGLQHGGLCSRVVRPVPRSNQLSL